MRTCTKCLLTKPDDAFALIREGRARYATCKKCKSSLKRAWAAANRAKVREYKRGYESVNREAKRAMDRNYYARHSARVIAMVTRYAKANRDKIRPYQAAYQSIRKRKQRAATPKWADTKAIQDVYERAALMQQADGITRHVDHIVPLAGRRVCGLHVVCNLQILTAKENRRKFNRHESELV